jgi:hypothetical protein
MGLTTSELFTSSDRLPKSVSGGRTVAAPTPMVTENA